MTGLVGFGAVAFTAFTFFFLSLAEVPPVPLEPFDLQLFLAEFGLGFG